MTQKIYTITSQVSSTRFTKDSNYKVEVYNAQSPLGANAKLGIVRPIAGGDFSYTINSQIRFCPATCINGILFEKQLTR